jgi:hypothetical protein
MNIWEVVCVKDLSKILKESPNKFVIIGLVLDVNEKKIQSYIKKFLKEKSQIYPNMTFVFYKVTKKDFNKISLISDDPEEYPIIYSIFDCENVFVKVNMAEPATIIESFNAVKTYYDDDLVKYLEEKSTKIITKSKSKTKSDSESESTKLSKPELEIPEQPTMPSMSQSELMEAQQKLMEKILCLENKTKEHNLEFLQDIKERKKSESLLKAKSKS